MVESRSAHAQHFVGADALKERLRSAVLSGQGGRSYLFTGPPQVGKRTLALWLARLLCCERRAPTDPEPCGECSRCARISRETYPDVRTFSLAAQAEAADRAAASREMGIDAIREIVGDISLLPFQGEYKVYIIDDAETLTDEAANGLLKTLEEPPSYAVLVLLAVTDASLPETVRSRCTAVRLGPASAADVLSWLRVEEPGANERLLERAAYLCEGRPGWALGAVRDLSVIEQHDAHVAELVAALGGGAAARLALAEKMGKQWSSGRKNARQGVYAELYDWLGFWREGMHLAAGGALPAGEPPYLADLRRISDRGVAACADAARATLEAVGRLDANVNTRMTVETLLLEIP